MTQQTPSEYLHNRMIRENTRYVIKNGVGYYLLKGVKITEKEMNEAYPLGIKIRVRKGQKGEDKDPTRAWMNEV